MLRHFPFTKWFNMQIILLSYPLISMIILEIREKQRKTKGNSYKTTYISAANCPKVQNIFTYAKSRFSHDKAHMIPKFATLRQ